MQRMYLTPKKRRVFIILHFTPPLTINLLFNNIKAQKFKKMGLIKNTNEIMNDLDIGRPVERRRAEDEKLKALTIFFSLVLFLVA